MHIWPQCPLIRLYLWPHKQQHKRPRLWGKGHLKYNKTSNITCPNCETQHLSCLSVRLSDPTCGHTNSSRNAPYGGERTLERQQQISNITRQSAKLDASLASVSVCPTLLVATPTATGTNPTAGERTPEGQQQTPNIIHHNCETPHISGLSFRLSDLTFGHANSNTKAPYCRGTGT